MNIIHAIINLVNHPETHIRQFAQGNNRANNMGNARRIHQRFIRK